VTAPADSRARRDPDPDPVETADPDPAETAEWLESLDGLLATGGADRARHILDELISQARGLGVTVTGAHGAGGISPSPVQLPLATPDVNTIAVDEQPDFPGDPDIERQITDAIRWNAAVMVSRANRPGIGVGGHIATFAGAATLYEVGFQHFFRGRNDPGGGDQVFFQGHASPGMYARAFLEGRLDEERLDGFRQELTNPGGGLPSYPHPRLMGDFWQFPTVSMGLGPIHSIYQARLNRYLDARGFTDTGRQRVWAFLGDGEMDEPESLGAIGTAAREQLDNLTWIVNCNLQRLDGPVRGNGKIMQELESHFAGAGWRVIKVVWGSEWDPLLSSPAGPKLISALTATPDGQMQTYSVEPGSYLREHLFGADPELARLAGQYTDEQLRSLSRGGHDPAKVYAAYEAATKPTGQPTVILAHTVKGWGLNSFEGRNATHQMKKLTLEDARKFRDILRIPITDESLEADPYRPPYFRFPDDSPQLRYLAEHRTALGGPLPQRVVDPMPLTLPDSTMYATLAKGSGKQRVATTMASVRLFKDLLRDKNIGRRFVPIIPDEARTFGLDAIFSTAKIYSPSGQTYTPVDDRLLLSYRESESGQILHEGINEAGAMASFIAAGTSYATHGEPLIPFYIFYSMFGFQRTGDAMWAAADQLTRGFLIGATAGRTTLNGEGLQHEDGHSVLLASTNPACISYDPAFAFEVAHIMRSGLERMYGASTDHPHGEDVFFYLTVYNEPISQPAQPEGLDVEGLLRGLYIYSPASGLASGDARAASTEQPDADADADADDGADHGANGAAGQVGDTVPRVQLLTSGSAMPWALEAQERLAKEWGVASDVWSATSWTELRRDALDCDAWNLEHPDESARVPYVTRTLAPTSGPVIAVTDYMRAVPDQIAPWVPGDWRSLGTDGFGRSDTRAALRRHFRVDAQSIVVAALSELAQRGEVKTATVTQALDRYRLDDVTATTATEAGGET